MDSLWSFHSVKVNPSYILTHDLKGIIIDSKKWIEDVDKYVQKDSVKALVIQINSPGGVVGPSQELYEFLKKVRDEYKKPVVAYSGGLMASGAYYTALGADKIVATPGAMIGSIGVIMEFLNLEGLYDWAKVKRFSITSGQFKDSGAEYRSMRDDEKALFQSLIDDVYIQFKNAIKESRNLSDQTLQSYADGRVFTGQQALDLGFIDEIGVASDAFELAADLANVSDFEIYKIPKEKPSLLDLLPLGGSEEDSEAHGLSKVAYQLLRADLVAQPLLILPGYWGLERSY